MAAPHRRKRLLVADMDSTIIDQECIDEMADVLGLKRRIAAITERAMRGELPFQDALSERLALLAGIWEAQLATVYRRRITLMPGARTLVATMKANGAHTALVSGGFTFFTSRVAAAVGFDANHANTLEFAKGHLTGGVTGPILGREAKLAVLSNVTAGNSQSSPRPTLAVGDGANDLGMIRAAGLGVAYRAKPIVACRGACQHHPRRSDGTALPAGLYEGRIRRGVTSLTPAAAAIEGARRSARGLVASAPRQPSRQSWRAP